MSYDGNVVNAAALSIVGGLLFGAFIEAFGKQRDRELAARGIPPGDHPVRPCVSVLVRGQTRVVIQESVARAMAQIGAKESLKNRRFRRAQVDLSVGQGGLGTFPRRRRPRSRSAASPSGSILISRAAAGAA